MTTIRSLIYVSLTLGALLVGSHTLQAQSVDYQDYNAIIFGNLSTTSDIEGRAFVGGDITSGNSANFGIHLPSNTATTDRSVVVGGNIFGGNPLNIQEGSVYVGGSTNGRAFNFNGGGSLVHDGSIAATVGSLQSYSIAESQALESLSSNSIVTLPSGQPGPTDFVANGNASGLAVFNVSASSIFDNPQGQQFDLSASAGTKNIVINVSGTSVNWTNGNEVSLFTDNYWRDHVIWNFYQATSINLGSHDFNGALLAPNASITTSNDIDGLVVASNLTTTSEVHLPGGSGDPYDGYVAPVPEPGGALLILSVGGVMLVARNRRLFA